MKPNLCVDIGGLKLKNPVTVASGTFGYAEEFSGFMDLNKLGAIVTKTITFNPRPGNPSPRTCETPAGMLNSIGLENPGLELFIQEKLSALKKLKPPLIVSVSSEGSLEEFLSMIKRLDKIKEIKALELNISCPNVKAARPQGSKITRLISQDPKATYEIVKSVRSLTKKTLITKLSPNVTDIVEIAQAAQEAGSDSLALINTLIGMSIDVKMRKPKIAAIMGGLSGPAIRPIAVSMVWQVYNKVRIPIIAMGGIIDTQSALEFLIAGATAISVGTANFINPRATLDIINGLEKYLISNNIKDINLLKNMLK